MPGATPPAGDTPAERVAPQPWMAEAPTQHLLDTLGAGGVAARFVGGCVRDALLGRPILDIDVATPAPPEEVTRVLVAAGIKVAPTGLAHGTVTAVVPPRHYEITTLRHDVETFGRHARVAFTADWAADALRRDFTMNALFLDREGWVFDFVGGLADLRARSVRFVGDPETRIREDVLRILRFYRFHAHYGKGPADAAARAACRALASLLPTLSAERVAAETLKLLRAPDPVPALAMMAEDGVLPIILPEARRPDRLAALVALEPTPAPMRRLAAVVEVDGEGALGVAQRLRLSNAERDRLHALAAPPWPVDLAGDDRAQRRALHHLGAALYCDLVLLAAAASGDPDRVPALLALASGWQPRQFPLKGRDVTRLGVPAGRKVGRLLAELREWWEAADFAPDRAACLAELEARIAKG